jgi:DNA-binding beta-propeller fold protein YncE
MPALRKIALAFLAGVTVASTPLAAAAQGQYPDPRSLPNPYRLDPSWPTLPKTMNGGHWGEVIRVHVEPNGNVWVFHRCFNTVPPGSAVCLNRGAANPPILQFDHAGKLLKSFGAGMFAYPHGFTVDQEGNIWTTDVNDAETVLGMSAKNAAGVVMGQEVLKLSPDGRVLMTLGKEGVSGSGHDAFDRPTGVAIAPNGDIFVSDGHLPNKHNNGRILKFSKDGKFIKSWGKRGAAPGEFDEPHDIFIGGSQNRLYVADRRNQRIQVFDLDGKFLAAWKQFGEPSSVFVGKDDTIYVGSGFKDPSAKRGEIRGIVVGDARDGSLKAFIPDPANSESLTRGTTSSGIAADAEGSIYSADVAAHNLRKYVKVR